MNDKIVAYIYDNGSTEYVYHLTDKRGVSVAFKTDLQTVKREVETGGLIVTARDYNKEMECLIITYSFPEKK